MRHIHLSDGLRLRFPARGEDFDEGVEIGMIAALMSLGQSEVRRRVLVRSHEQLTAVAAKLGYHLAEEVPDGDWVDVTFCAGRARPRLTLVHCTDESKLKALSR